MDRFVTVRIPKRLLRIFLVVAVTTAVVAPVSVFASHTFTDVSDSNVFSEDIVWLSDNGVTKGCNPPANTEFCPKDNVTREQLAAFMRRLAENQVVDAGTVGGLTADQLKGEELAIVLDVDTKGFADFDFTGAVGDPATVGAFYVSGDILTPGTSTVIGTFQCWGWIRPDGGGVVTQEYDIDGRGRILIAGTESGVPRGVTGGTGDFANARGEAFPDMVLFDTGTTGKFRISFNLIGGEGLPITAGKGA